MGEKKTARERDRTDRDTVAGRRRESFVARLMGWLRPADEESPDGEEDDEVETDRVQAVAALEWATAEAVVTVRRAGAEDAFPALLEAAGTDLPEASGARHHPVTGGRRALALGLGLAEAGRRVAILAGADGVAAAGDLLAEAGRRRLPLVIHTPEPSPAAPPGVVVLAPSTVQEVVDWTLLARALAERALAPVVVAGDPPPGDKPVAWPPADRVRRFVGRPVDGIHPPGVQELTHGEHRRRLPVLLDGRQPLLSGALHRCGGQEEEAGGFAAAGEAAGAVFLDRAVGAILDDLIERFAARFGRRPEVVRCQGNRRSAVQVVATGPPARVAGEALSRSGHGKGAGLCRVVCRTPPPVTALAEALAEGAGKVRTVLVLEPPSAAGNGEEPPLAAAVGAAVERAWQAAAEGRWGRKGRKPPRVLPVLWGAPGQALDGRDLLSLMDALEAGEAVATADGVPLWLGMDFAPRVSGEPKRQVLHDAVRRLAPGAAGAGWVAPAGERETDGPPVSSSSLPPFVRRLGSRSGGRTGLASLPRFVDQVLPLTAGSGKVPPDPHLAFPVLPPLSAVFRPPAPRVGPVPAFEAAACTGCGACWTSCPHGAFEPRVLSPKELLEAGLERARATGDNADPLRRVLARLGKELARELAATPGAALGELLDRAFARLPATSRRPVTDAFAALRRAMGELPVACTEVFGDDRAFLLGLDPVACTGCGLCVEVCEPDALTVPEDADPARVEELEAPARRLVATLRELPAPAGDALERAGAGEPGEVGAALLDPVARTVMAPGEGAPAGSTDALALRRTLALAARQGRARLTARRQRAAKLQEALAEALRSELTGALPAGDLDALARGVAALEEPEARLGDLLGHLEEAFDAPRVDVERLRRRVDMARRLAGRYGDEAAAGGDDPDAPCALVLGPGRHLEWSASFPWNPFAVPVVVADAGEDDVLARARGLALGWRERWQEDGELLGEVSAELGRPAAGAADGEATDGEATDGEPPPLVLALAAEPSADFEPELEALGVTVLNFAPVVPAAVALGAAADDAAATGSGAPGESPPPADPDQALAEAERRHRAELARQLADLDERWRQHLAREKAAWQQAMATQVRQRLRHWAGLEPGGEEA